jgi:hypothetical protein
MEVLTRIEIVAAAALIAGACGLGLTDERSGGAENLPTSGAGPYERIEFDFDSPINEPYVIEDRNASFRDPSALARGDGGFRLWFSRTAAGGVPEIWSAELPGLHDLPDVGPNLAFAATDAWEMGRVEAPDVIEQPDGSLIMFYEAGDPTAPAIGRADSSDGGATWQKHAANPVLDGAGDPAAVEIEDGDWQLYATRAGADGIYRADSADGVAWTFAPAPVIQARPSLDGAFDRFEVGDPFAIAGRSSAGRTVIGLFFNGADGPDEDSDVAVGYAGSFDGEVWDRFLGADATLLSRELPVEGPTVVLAPRSGTMFFHEVSTGRGKIAAATHP